MNIELEELGLAYRRVKADLFYTRNANTFKLLAYEKHLSSNLKHLYDCLVSRDYAVLYSYCFGYRIVPKGIVFEGENDQALHSTVSLGDERRTVKTCDLRLIEDLPIDFHVIVQLWIDRVGGQFERCISDDVYGYRLRVHDNHVNKLYPGTFKHWMSQYRKWHDKGLDEARKALSESKKDVVILTADFSSFFHNLSAGFLRSEAFQQAIGVESLSEDDRMLTHLVVDMLDKWAEKTPLEMGLPVGCSISAVIANLALVLFDRAMAKLSGKIYYGRYVDDIILVRENEEGLSSKDAVFKWLENCFEGNTLQRKNERFVYSAPCIELKGDGELSFNEDKTQVFILNKEDGVSFIDSLKEQIKKRSSEWRSMPDLPDTPEELVKSIVAITDRHGVEVDKLRQAEEISIRRAAFAMKLSDFADFTMCLDSDEWGRQRESFIRAVETYFTSLKSYFDLYKYFPRLVALAAHGVRSENDNVRRIIASIYKRIAGAIEKALRGEVRIASKSISDLRLELVDVSAALQKSVTQGMCEAIATSVSDEKLRRILYDDQKASFRDCGYEAAPPYDELLLADLAIVPYKSLLFAIYDMQSVPPKIAPYGLMDFEGVLPSALIDNAMSILRSNKGCWGDLIRHKAISGLVFPVVPLKPFELYAILPRPYDKASPVRGLILDFMRLHSYGDRDEDFLSFEKVDGGRVITVPFGKEESESVERGVLEKRGRNNGIKVALAYWRIAEESWSYQLNGGVDKHKTSKYNRIMRLVNRIMQSGEKIDYVQFPELAMPWRWFMLIAKKLRRYNVSLISGVEYLKSGKGLVRNEAWCSLMYDGLGFPDSVLIKILKTDPADEERSELKNRFAYQLDVMPRRGDFCAGDIIVHGDGARKLFFSVLICSDLTNIDLRAKLRGKIDALFVPAWNHDVQTFNALITASAFDLHAYVVLCNNGVFGDTRIRAPFENRYDRDLVQLKGGDYDYYVVGSLDVAAIRRFQAGRPAPSDVGFKSAPKGFCMSMARRDEVEVIDVNCEDIELKYVHVEKDGINVWGEGPDGEPIDVGLKIAFLDINTLKKLLKWLGILEGKEFMPKRVSWELAVVVERYLCVEDVSDLKKLLAQFK